jgi:hypothetical protein
MEWLSIGSLAHNHRETLPPPAPSGIRYTLASVQQRLQLIATAKHAHCESQQTRRPPVPAPTRLW